MNLLEGRVEEPMPDGYLTGVELGITCIGGSLSSLKVNTREGLQVNMRGNGAISTGMWRTNSFRCAKSVTP